MSTLTLHMPRDCDHDESINTILSSCFNGVFLTPLLLWELPLTDAINSSTVRDPCIKYNGASHA